MTPKIVFYRATGAVVIEDGMTDIRKDILTNWAYALTGCEIDRLTDNLTSYRNKLLDAIDDCYSGILASAEACGTDALPDPESLLVFVVETIAVANAADLCTLQRINPNPDGNTIARYAARYQMEGEVMSNATMEIPNHAADARRASIKIPELPEVVTRGHWNGKVYGSYRKGYKVYIDGNLTDITNEDYNKIIDHSRALEAYPTERKAKMNAAHYVVVNEPDDDDPWSVKTVDTHGLNLSIGDLRRISDKTHACSAYVHGAIYYNTKNGAISIVRWCADEDMPMSEYETSDDYLGITGDCCHYKSPQELADQIAEVVKLSKMTKEEISEYWNELAKSLID